MIKNYIELNNINYKDILNNFSISFFKNKFYTLTGANSCGKSTLLRLISNEIELIDDINLNDKLLSDYDKIDYKRIVTLLDENNLSFSEEIISNNSYSKEYLKSTLLKYDLYESRNRKINNLSLQEKIYLMFIKIVLGNYEVILIDNIDNYCDKTTIDKIINIINYIKNNKLIIMTIKDINYSLESDELIVINKKGIVLKGKPIDVLNKDNILNKNGIELPFMYDLSIKLRDYNLVDEIILDQDRMIDKLKQNINFCINENTIFGITGTKYKELLSIFNIINKYTNVTINKNKLNNKNILFYQNKITNIKKINELDIKVEDYLEKIIIEHDLQIKKINKKIEDSLTIVGINKDKKELYIKDLSTSEKNLLRVSISLLFNPEIIILDEPYFGLDIKNIKRLNILFNRLTDQYKKTIILGSSDSNELYKYTKKMIFISNNNILKIGDTKEIYKNVKFLKDNNFDIPESVIFTYNANNKKSIKLDYLQDIRDIIKDIYKHI